MGSAADARWNRRLGPEVDARDWIQRKEKGAFKGGVKRSVRTRDMFLQLCLREGHSCCRRVERANVPEGNLLFVPGLARKGAELISRRSKGVKECAKLLLAVTEMM